MSKKRKILIGLSLCVALFITGFALYMFSHKPNMTAEQLVTKMQEAGLPIDGVIVYDEKTDPNKLLGRPNQYPSKTNFADTRLDQTDPENPNGGTIEVFNNSSDLEKRKKHNEMVMEQYPVFTEYLFVHDNYIIRLSYDLTKDQAEEYKKIFMSIK